jgi:hypothetical protein
LIIRSSAPRSRQRTHLNQRGFAVLHRHVEIEYGEIRQIFTERIDSRAAVVDQTDAMPVCLKSPAQEQGQRLVVFGNQ